MSKVAIIIPTMNRPDFILRQLRFYEMMKSPHPVYILDSSKPENAEKITSGIKQLDNVNVVYQWVEPGNDYEYKILPMVKEKYCIQVGDDDLVIPQTMSECADFLESHPDYGTCAGKQVNIRFRKEDYNKPYGIIDRQTLPIGRSIEDENLIARIKNYMSGQETPFMGFTVRRIEIEKDIRDMTQNFFMMGDMTEFLIMFVLITAGKLKFLDRIGCFMQISNNRTFDHSLTENFLLSSTAPEQWKICEEGFSAIIQKQGISPQQSKLIVRWLILANFAGLYYSGINTPDNSSLKNIEKPVSVNKNVAKVKKIKQAILSRQFIRRIYYKLKPPLDITRPESIYFKDYKIVKNFLENDKI